MFSVHQAASIFYYLGLESGQDPERVLLADSASPGGAPTYYDPLASSDPLWVQATWTGKLAEQLGLPDGHPVTKSGLAAMWFGIDPRDGLTPLAHGGPSVAQQVSAQKSIARAEEALRSASVALGKARAALLNEGHGKDDVDARPATVALRRAVDDAKAQVKAAKSDPGHRQDAHDCVFSAPKGLSIYWARLKADGVAGDSVAAAKAKALEQAMLASVRAVIEGYVEPQLLFTRSRSGGRKSVDFENVKGIGCALFPHFDARPTTEEAVDPITGATRTVSKMPDPQMHVHGLLMSIGLDHSDEVRTLWTTFLGSHAKAIGAAFRGELAGRLRDLGLEVRQELQEKVLSFELSGVDEHAIAAFSSRAAQVEANAGAGMGRQESKLSGRETKADYTGADMLDDWRVRMDAMGLTSTQMATMTNAELARREAIERMRLLSDVGAVDHHPGDKSWDDQFEVFRSRALTRLEGAAPSVDQAVEQLLEMESAFTMTDIAKVAFEASQFCHRELRRGQSPMAWAESFKASILRHPELKQVHGEDRYGRPSFTSRGLIRREKKLYYESIPRLLAERPAALDAATVEQSIELYERTESEKRGEAFTLKDFQRDMVRDIALNRASIHLALAPAGCGKTTAALGAVLALEADGCRVFSLAPSNKAAQGLATDLRKGRRAGMSPQKLLGKIRRGEVELTSKDVLFVDEASMLAFDHAEGLVQAALSARGGPARIILMGDIEQLPAVGRGNFMRALAESERFDDAAEPGARNITRVASSAAHWNRINRQRSDLAKQATAYFALGENAKALDIYERMGALKLSATREEALSALAHDAYLPLSGAASDLLEAREQREARHKALSSTMAIRLTEFSGSSKTGAIDREAVIGSFPDSERASARQWFEDKTALESARAAVIDGYRSTLLLATKNADADALNERARAILKSIGALGGSDGMRRHTIHRGKAGRLEICEGERLMFTEKADASQARFSEPGDSAAKSTVGTVIAVNRDAKGEVRLVMELDGVPGRVIVNTRTFDKFSYAYAMTAHSSQGATCSKVFEYASEFASMQTDYVGKTRHRDGHAIYGVESTYELHKKRAAEAIVKVDAKDLALAAEAFGVDVDQLGPFVDAVESHRVAAELRVRAAANARLRQIGQGKLVRSGDAPLGFTDGSKPSHFAIVEVEGREITFWGDGLRAELASLGAKLGDHIGLEPQGGARSSGESLMWRAHSAAALASAGLLLDGPGIERMADEAAANRGGPLGTSGSGFESMIDSCFLAQGEAKALCASMIAKSTTLAARRVAEDGILAELDRRAALPEDMAERLSRAAAALPFAKRGASSQIRELIALGGILAMPYERPVIAKGREWLAHDDELAYCATEWGTIEAWSAKKLPEWAMSEARSIGGAIDRLERRRDEAMEAGNERCLGPARRAFGSLGSRLDVTLVEHATRGLCLGINAAEAGAHRADPELKALFTGEGEYGMDASMKKGGIGGLRSCRGFDPSLGAWIFPISVDEGGIPSRQQRAVDELVELGTRLGHALEPANPWDDERSEAWSAIESRLASPWGRLFEKACSSAGVDVRSAKVLADKTLGGKSKDIVRWDAQALAGDSALEWEFCSAVGADGEAMDHAKRRLAGVVLHATESDLYVLRGQRVLAVERTALGAGGPPEEWLGRQVRIAFEKGHPPEFESVLDDPWMAQARELAARVQAGMRMDTRKLSDAAARAMRRAFPDGPLSPADLGCAVSWAVAEAADLDALRAARSSQMGPASAGARVIEEFASSDMLLASAAVVEVGPQGVLFESEGRCWLADAEQARQAMGRRLSATPLRFDLRLRMEPPDRFAIDARATRKAMAESREQR